ncbi:secretogranin-2 [Cyprinodon tularosa]|uniref:secretogranin-2 n=1 Tax=Cyprinodon tularosa TaxID=77115 RepID=UPI0018E2603C|nr:secretogranin-2 [Cyprinodon tularosa]
MPSLPQTSPPLIYLAAILWIFLTFGVVEGASIRDHRLRGSKSDSPEGDVLRAQDTDMLKALEYIESLHHRAPHILEHDASRMDDAEKLRAMLRPASDPKQSHEEQEEKGSEDKSEELLQAVLSTLQQTEKAARPALLGAVPQGMSTTYPRMPQKAHRKLPLLFEDEEAEERGEEAQRGDTRHESPFKRTKENVEGRYTPQNLATLQSVFDELDKLTGANILQKRQDEDGDMEEDETEDDEEMSNRRNAAYDDMDRDLLEWGPLDEEEEEEEESDSDHGADYIEDNDEDAGNNDEEDDSFPVKRSSDADDVVNLVDHYLLKVLEKTEEEQEKGEAAEGGGRTERWLSQNRYPDNIDPRVIYQLLTISQRFQIPAEDLTGLLKPREQTDDRKLRKTNKLSEAERKFSKISSKKATPAAHVYNRRPPYVRKTPEEQRTEEILKVLGIGGEEEPAPPMKQRQQNILTSQLHSHPAGRWRESAPTQRRLPHPFRDDYDDTEDQDELAAYLAQMLNPKPAFSNTAPQKRQEVGQSTTDSLEKTMEEYFDLMDKERRQSEDSETRAQSWENEAVMKMLNYLNPEEEEAKTAKGK